MRTAAAGCLPSYRPLVCFGSRSKLARYSAAHWLRAVYTAMSLWYHALRLSKTRLDNHAAVIRSGKEESYATHGQTEGSDELRKYRSKKTPKRERLKAEKCASSCDRNQTQSCIRFTATDDHWPCTLVALISRRRRTLLQCHRN